MRYLIITKHHVRPARLAEFLADFQPDGRRAQLLRNADGYLWTSLSKAVRERCAYITLDVWRSHTDLENFRSRHAADWTSLETTCAGFMEKITPVFAGDALTGK